MTLAFTYQGSAAHIVFGNEASADVGRWVEALGCRRALVLSTPHQAADGEALAERLGALSVGTFAEAAMHTPVEVTARAVARAAELGADCVVSLGGGSTTGLGKAMAYSTDIPQIVVPTTYAGSEVTPILGQTENGAKTTLRSPKVTPEVVIYDPQLTMGLPVGMSVTSGLNAIAHAAEGLYAADRNPITTMMAIERDDAGDVVGDARSGRTLDVLPVLLGRVFSLFLLLNLTGLSSRIASRYVAIKLLAFIGKTAPAISNHLGETVFEWQSKKNTK